MKLTDVFILSAPKRRHSRRNENEIRFELPYDGYFGGLCYFGVVRSSKWEMKLHCHDHFELCYLDEGAGWFTIDNQLQKIEEGNFFVVRPGEIHEGTASPDSAFRLYYLGFDVKQIQSLELDYYSISSSRILKDDSGMIKQFCQTIIHELEQPQSYSKDMVRGVLMQMLVVILRVNQKYDPSERNECLLSPQVKQALQVIRSDVNCRIDINELAKKLNYSRSHFEREFKQVMGISIGKYTRELFLDEAKKYLRYTTHSITSISEDLNFESIHHFSLFFKRHTGYSPLDYRKSHNQMMVMSNKKMEDEKVKRSIVT